MADAAEPGADVELPSAAADPGPRPGWRVGPRARRVAVALVVAAALIALTWRPVCRALPGLLIERAPPRSAQAIVVLAGDHRGGRVAEGARLHAAGWLAPDGLFVVSGGPIYAETSWAALMAARATALGIPSEQLRAQDRSTTTAEDARFSLALLLSEAAALGAPADDALTVLLVTSAWHSGRAARLFRREAERLAPGRIIIIISCPSPDPPSAWWQDPEATRDLVTELLKRLWPGPGA